MRTSAEVCNPAKPQEARRDKVGGLEAEVDEEAAEVFAVFVDAVVVLFHLWLLKEAEDLLFQLAAALAGDDLDELDLLVDRLVDDVAEGVVDCARVVVDVVKVKFQLSHVSDCTPLSAEG